MKVNKGGAPNGNKNGVIGREGRRALEIALDQFDPDNPDKPIKAIGRIRTIARMWTPIIKKAILDGDLAALKEINDRLDGRPIQAVELDVAEGISFNLNYTSND